MENLSAILSISALITMVLALAALFVYGLYKAFKKLSKQVLLFLTVVTVLVTAFAIATAWCVVSIICCTLWFFIALFIVRIGLDKKPTYSNCMQDEEQYGKEFQNENHLGV